MVFGLLSLLGIVSALSVLVPGFVLLTLIREVKAPTLRNLSIILASFAILHGLYHILLLYMLAGIASFVDLATVIILIFLGVYYGQRVAGSFFAILALPDVARDLVPVGLFVALILFIRLAIKSKSIRSLQAQLSIFLSIWIVAELLRSLILLGVIEASPILVLLGVAVHTVSMAAFGFFILFRFYRLSARSGQRLPEEERNFDAIMRNSIQRGLRELLGDNTARAVEFHLDSSIAFLNIRQYTNSLEKIFKDGSQVLEMKFAETLYADLGLAFEKKENYRLPDYVNDARKKKG